MKMMALEPLDAGADDQIAHRSKKGPQECQRQIETAHKAAIGRKDVQAARRDDGCERGLRRGRTTGRLAFARDITARVIDFGPTSLCQIVTDGTGMRLLRALHPRDPARLDLRERRCIARRRSSPQSHRHAQHRFDFMTERMRNTPRGMKPFVMTNLKTLSGLANVVQFIETKGMLHA